jgi:hypothetical protein
MIISRVFMLVPSVAADYSGPLMRSYSDPLMLLFFLHPFILGIILAWAWDKSKVIFSGRGFEQGMKFGFAVWLVATVPGMYATWTSFNFSILTVLSWVIGSLVALGVAGILFAKMNPRNSGF